MKLAQYRPFRDWRYCTRKPLFLRTIDGYTVLHFRQICRERGCPSLAFLAQVAVQRQENMRVPFLNPYFNRWHPHPHPNTPSSRKPPASVAAGRSGSRRRRARLPPGRPVLAPLAHRRIIQGDYRRGPVWGVLRRCCGRGSSSPTSGSSTALWSRSASRAQGGWPA